MAKKVSNDSQAYKAVKSIMAQKEMSQQEVAEKTGHENGNLWRKMRSGDVRLNWLNEICDNLGASLVIETEDGNRYKLNSYGPKK